MNHDLSGKTIAMLATDGVEQQELEEPRDALQKAGATVHVVSVHGGSIRAWNHRDWGDEIAVDRTLDEVSAEDYDGLVVPGGVMSPDALRTHPGAVSLVREFDQADKPMASLCHGPWMMVEADVVNGRRLTSWPSLRTDLVHAGAQWEDSEVVVDCGVVTSRGPDDLPAFCARMVEEMAEGRHPRHRSGSSDQDRPQG